MLFPTKNKALAQGMVLLFDSNRGRYIPQFFAEECNHWQGLNGWAMGVMLKGPEEYEYWEAWNEVENNAYYIDERGNKFTLYHDGDLWAVCYDLMTEEEKENFGFNDY